MSSPTTDRPAIPPKISLSEPTPKLCLLSDLLGEWEKDAEAAHAARQRNEARGPVTGFRKLDEDIGGYIPVGLSIMHGQPGAGKTAFALQVAAQCGFPALYVSCEMSPLELLRRQTARVTGTYLQRLKSGELSTAESLAFARRGASAAPQLALVDATQAGATLSYIQRCIEIIRARMGSGSWEGQDEAPRQVLLIIDSLHSWAEGVSEAGQATEYEILNAALAGLRSFSHSANCPVLAIAERNRDSMKSGGLSAGAGTRKLEYGAEIVIDLSRTDEREEVVGGKTSIVARLVKNRHGAVGKETLLFFHGAVQKFELRSLRQDLLPHCVLWNPPQTVVLS